MSFLFLLFFFLFLSPFTAQAIIPIKATFKLVNRGPFGSLQSEHNANYRNLSIATPPFQLFFYNTTPNAYTLALGMVTTGWSTEASIRWVWEANRGKPVRENAVLKFSMDGNLVLSDSDGRIAWQTNTSNKGATGMELLPNGNLVLHSRKGNFVWQSFDYPTDTLLMGQTLYQDKKPNKLVSRTSDKNNANGLYSLVVMPEYVAFNYTSPQTLEPITYDEFLSPPFSHVGFIKLDTTPSSSIANGHEINIVTGGNLGENVGHQMTLATPRYNSTFSFLRIGSDGNLRVFTYDNETSASVWEQTFTYFGRDPSQTTECILPERCGRFGLCDNNQCIACPTPHGLLGWSEDCVPPKLTSCDPKSFKYYKLKGVGHSLSNFWNRLLFLSEKECESKCTADCKCSAYFYNEVNLECWIVHDLKTLIKIADRPTYVGFIKTSLK